MPRMPYPTILFLVTLGSCTSASDDPRISSSLIEGSSQEIPLARTVSLAGEIFRDAENRELFIFLSRSVLSAERSGYLHVFDDVSGSVIILDSVGHRLAARGARGGGPGEFRNVTGIGVTPDGVLAVYDAAKRALVRFDSGGKVLSEWNELPVHRGGPIGLSDNHATFVTAFLDTKTHLLRQALVRLDSSGVATTIVQFESPLPRGIRFPGCPRPVVLNKLFSPSLVIAKRSGRIAVSKTARYEIMIIDGPTKRMRIGRDIDPQRATMALALKELEGTHKVMISQGSCTIPPEANVEARGYAEYVPIIDDLAISPAGEIWVHRRGIQSETSGTDIFSPHGQYLGSLTAGTPFPTTFIDDSQYASIEEDSAGELHLRIYRVTTTSRIGSPTS